MGRSRELKANIAPFGLRMQPELKERIEAEAAKNERSINAEIVARLEESFAPGSASALQEAARIAESLRVNLTQRIASYDALVEKFELREQLLEARREAYDERDRELQEREVQLVEEYQSRREALERQYREMIERSEKAHRNEMARLAATQKAADEYAGFTIARERQFVQALKNLTGVEPPPVVPVPKNERRGRK